MIVIENDFNKDIMNIFRNTITKIFGDETKFLEFIEYDKYSTYKYDCFLDFHGENYIINRETGEHINWYGLDDTHRRIDINLLVDELVFNIDIPKWIEEFLVEFKKQKDSIEQKGKKCRRKVGDK